jgi:uncharacterized circularly permuted ATP-grasp superfamily protein
MRSVPTYLCMREKDREYVLENIADLVVKPANESGGYGIMVGPHVDQATHRKFAPPDRKGPAQLHRAADPVPVDGADLHRR